MITLKTFFRIYTEMLKKQAKMNTKLIFKLTVTAHNKAEATAGVGYDQK